MRKMNSMSVWSFMVFTAILLSAVSAWSAGTTGTENFCAASGAVPELVTHINGTPSYFAKVTPDGKEMGFILGGGNYLLKLSSASTMVHVPGPYDPVPTPDGKYILIPVNGGMSFFLREKLDALAKSGQTVDASDAKPEFTDTDLTGNYQSAGILSKENDGSVRYRVDISGMQYGDYQVDNSGKITREGSLHKMCTNVAAGESLRLPMLSKDGQMVAAFDSDSSTTKIYHIDGENCTEMLDLGLATGKVEFSFDGTRITFHADTFNSENQGGFFSGVEASVSKNVYVADLDRSDPSRLAIKTIRRVTNNKNPGVGSYYPSFTADGRIVFINGVHEKYSFQLVDPNQLQSADFRVDGSAAASYALGYVWAKSCAPRLKLTPEDYSLWYLSLTPEACASLVQSKWDDMKSQAAADPKLIKVPGVTADSISSLDQRAVLAACPQGGSVVGSISSHEQTIYVAHDPNKILTGEQVFKDRCYGCHDTKRGEAPHIDWNKMTGPEATLVLTNLRLPQGADLHMPPNTILDPRTEMQPLVQALLEKGGTQ